MIYQSINQSINQISIAPLSQAKPSLVAWQPNRCSTAKLMKQFRNISEGHRACWCLWGTGQVKEMCLQMFLEGSNWNGWMGRQREVVQKRQGTRVKSSCACVGLVPRDRQTNSLVWSQWTEWEWCGKHGVKINRLVFMKRLVGQQTDLEQYSKFHWYNSIMTQYNTVYWHVPHAFALFATYKQRYYDAVKWTFLGNPS